MGVFQYNALVETFVSSTKSISNDTCFVSSEFTCDKDGGKEYCPLYRGGDGMCKRDNDCSTSADHLNPKPCEDTQWTHSIMTHKEEVQRITITAPDRNEVQQVKIMESRRTQDVYFNASDMVNFACNMVVKLPHALALHRMQLHLRSN